MLCDDTFISLALDVPVTESHIRFSPSTAVRYAVNETAGIWSKVIDLEYCDRADFVALFSNSKFLRKLALVLPKTLDGNVISASLPKDIRIDGTEFVLSYTWSPLGSAFDVIQRLGSLSEQVVAAIIARAVSCLADLHEHGILHREICSKHLLLVESSESVQVKLCGFGSATEYMKNCNFVARNDIPPIHFSWRGWNVGGNQSHPMSWYAPEMVAQDFTGYSCPADIYSLGLTIGELFNGVAPHENQAASEILLEKLCDGGVPKLEKPGNPEPPSLQMSTVYRQCTQRDPSRRPTAQDLLQHPWIRWGLEQSLSRADIVQKEKSTTT